MQARMVYPKVLAFAVCRSLGINPPHIIVQVWDPKERRWKTGKVEL